MIPEKRREEDFRLIFHMLWPHVEKVGKCLVWKDKSGRAPFIKRMCSDGFERHCDARMMMYAVIHAGADHPAVPGEFVKGAESLCDNAPWCVNPYHFIIPAEPMNAMDLSCEGGCGRFKRVAVELVLIVGEWTCKRCGGAA
ncbi:hypothetical protein AB0J20_04990 [Micromonospora costi]|uniref:hypothetical protein n=1 Tax=Micromonospora costi TaxID=1530042 RepID=UPI0033DF7B37